MVRRRAFTPKSPLILCTICTPAAHSHCCTTVAVPGIIKPVLVYWIPDSTILRPSRRMKYPSASKVWIMGKKAMSKTTKAIVEKKKSFCKFELFFSFLLLFLSLIFSDIIVIQYSLSVRNRRAGIVIPVLYVYFSK